jgi:hypothetical protein
LLLFRRQEDGLLIGDVLNCRFHFPPLFRQTVFALATAFSLPNAAGPLRIGMNLAGPADWGSEWPFADIMKYCRTWIPFNSVWVEGGANPWDTGVIDRIPADENGYPLALPYDVEGTEAPQAVRTVWANTQTLPEGVYTVLFDGEGVLNCSFDASVTAEAPGRLDVRVTPGKDNIMSLEILESKAGNPVRNIRFLLPGTEGSAAENPWCSEWLEKLEPFKVLRFMDWGFTNNSTLERWEDRPRVGDYTYTSRGVPYERMIEICNRKMADAWVCVPHLADDDFIRRMAELFRDSLDPSLRIHVEYSNETWNWMFEQTQYLNEHGNQSVPWPERTVPFVQNVMDIWSGVFAGQMERLVRVVGVQHAWQDVSNRVVFNMRQGSFDAFSPAAYFGFSDAGYAALEALGSSATAEDALYWAREGMLSNSCAWTKSQHRSIAAGLGVPMIYYEGGQHMTPNPFGTDRPYNQALMDAQTHPDMYVLYREWLDTLKTFSDPARPALFMNFSFIGPKSGKYGSWGALESQFGQTPPYVDTAPKYQALLDELNAPASSAVLPVADPPSGLNLEGGFPNPFNGAVAIGFSLSARSRVRAEVFDASGRRVRTLLDSEKSAGSHSTVWDARDGEGRPAPSGAYVCRVYAAGRESRTVKLLLVR